MREYQRVVARQQTKEIWAVVLSLVVLTLCAIVTFGIYAWSRPESDEEATSATVVVGGETTLTFPTLTSTAMSTAPLLASTDTPTPIPTPSAEPSPTAALSSTIAPPPAISSQDAKGDVMTYDTGEPVAAFPGGIDIRAASVRAGLQVSLRPADDAPAEALGWATGDDALLWLSLYDPIPNPPDAFTDWVFVLDVDGDPATGRPAGTVLINPDLGYEVAIGVSYNEASANYEPYFLVWDPGQGRLVVANTPRFMVNESRTLIGLALPMASLTESVEQIAGATLSPGAVRGRAAAQSIVGGRKVIDVYPELPE
jgi:hypothetical protein